MRKIFGYMILVSVFLGIYAFLVITLTLEMNLISAIVFAAIPFVIAFVLISLIILAANLIIND